MELTPAEGRVLGCLIEKQVDGPVAYSPTLNELRYACNQTTGRDPVVTYDDRTIEETVMSLKSKGLARFVPAATSGRHRGPVRCRHRAEERWRLNPPQLTVLSVLLLRGPQTVEDVRSLVTDQPLLETPSEVEAVLDSLAGRTPTPFATRMPPAAAGQDVRWVEVLTGRHDPDEVVDLDAVENEARLPLYSAPAPSSAPPGSPSPAGPAPSPLTMVELADRLSNIERRLAGIEAAIGALRTAVEEGGVGSPHPSSRVRT